MKVFSKVSIVLLILIFSLLPNRANAFSVEVGDKADNQFEIMPMMVNID